MTDEERIVWLSAFGSAAAAHHPDNHKVNTFELCCDRADYALELYILAAKKMAIPAGVRKVIY